MVSSIVSLCRYFVGRQEPFFLRDIVFRSQHEQSPFLAFFSFLNRRAKDYPASETDRTKLKIDIEIETRCDEHQVMRYDCPSRLGSWHRR
jgi:hypothetical protein